jgi:hypothetical protein
VLKSDSGCSSRQTERQFHSCARRFQHQSVGCRAVHWRVSFCAVLQHVTAAASQGAQPGMQQRSSLFPAAAESRHRMQQRVVSTREAARVWLVPGLSQLLLGLVLLVWSPLPWEAVAAAAQLPASAPAVARAMGCSPLVLLRDSVRNSPSRTPRHLASCVS